MQNISLRVVIPFLPKPKQRPRFSKGRTYTPKQTNQSEEEIVWHLHNVFHNYPPITGPVHLSLTFFIKRGKSVKRPHPTVKPDLDNFAKTVMDAITKAEVWVDDAQVVKLVVEKRYTTDAPKTVLQLTSV